MTMIAEEIIAELPISITECSLRRPWPDKKTVIVGYDGTDPPQTLFRATFTNSEKAEELLYELSVIRELARALLR